VYNGLFAENNNPTAALSVNCPTGNCTWPQFDTLAVCYYCDDMTTYMSRYCPNNGTDNGNTTDCGWILPNGAALDGSEEVFSMTSQFPSFFGDMPHTTIMKLTFMGTEAQNGAAGSLNPWALQCTLQVCVQTLESGVINGALSENVTATHLNGTVVDMSRAGGDYNVYITPNASASAAPDGQNTTYVMGMGSLLGMQSWFSTIFANGSASRNPSYLNKTITEDTLIVNLTVGISSGETFFDTDVVTAFYWNYYEYASGLSMLMQDLATSMTVSLRSFNGAVPAAGTALRDETFVHVRWGFIALPVLVVILTALFLAAMMWRSRRSGAGLWKSSALAMLLHGVDEETRREFSGAENLQQEERVAKGVMVQLDNGEGMQALLRM